MRGLDGLLAVAVSKVSFVHAFPGSRSYLSVQHRGDLAMGVFVLTLAAGSANIIGEDVSLPLVTVALPFILLFVLRSMGIPNCACALLGMSNTGTPPMHTPTDSFGGTDD